MTTIYILSFISIMLAYVAIWEWVSIRQLESELLLHSLHNNIDTLISSIDELTPKLNAYKPKLAKMPNPAYMTHEFEQAESALSKARFNLEQARHDLASKNLKSAQDAIDKGLACVNAVQAFNAKLFMATVQL